MQPINLRTVENIKETEMATTILTVILAALICWNLFLHRKLSIESLQRRELAIAFRQFMIERRGLVVA
jgi:hypothetical protein